MNTTSPIELAETSISQDPLMTDEIMEDLGIEQGGSEDLALSLQIMEEMEDSPVPLYLALCQRFKYSDPVLFSRTIQILALQGPRPVQRAEL